MKTIRRPRPRRFVRREDPHKINRKIEAPEVRMVGEGIEPGVYPIRKALEMADEQDLDLVEISPKAEPPVCKILDYKKFLFEQRKKQKELKAKATKIVVKEIRFGPNTDDHDFQFKLKHAKQFLEAGAKVRAFVFFRGRAIVYKDKGEILLLRFADELEDLAKVEMMPKMEGKKMFIILNPKKRSKKG